MDEIKKIPPVTRTLIFATAGVTLPPLLKLINPYAVLLWWPAVFKKWEIWRPITCFFLGGGDLQLLFDIFMLLRNSTDLETNFFYRKTSEYAWALLMINSMILATNYPLQSAVLFSPFLMAIVYLWSRANPAASVSFFGLITCPAPYLPYAYLFLDLLRGGLPLAIQSSTGIVSAYIYWYLREVLPASNGGRGPRLLPATPSLLRRLLPDSPDPAVQGQAPPPGGSIRATGWGGTAFAPAGRNWGDAAPSTSSSSAGGQRLNSGGSGSSGGLRSWLPFGGGNGSTSSTGSVGTGSRRAEGPDRQAMLAAAEERLRALRANSIAGRNQAASALAQQAANSPEAQARQRRAGSGTSAKASTGAPAGSVLSPGVESKSSGVHRRDGASQIRRTAAVGGASSQAFSFGQYDAKKGRAGGEQEGQEEEQETASGSGGRVAEIRRPADAKEEKKATPAEDPEYSWGSGRRLGD